MVPSTSAGRTGAWILGDQLSLGHPLLEQLSGPVVLIEAESLLRRLPYHRKKLVLLLSAMRHYAEALRARGIEVCYVRAPSMGVGLRRAVQEMGLVALVTVQASSYHGAIWQRERAAEVAGVPVQVLPGRQFLIDGYAPPPPRPGTRMETFYRSMRRHYDVLMTAGGEPVGGVWNLDTENRKPLPTRVQVPSPRRFSPDAITRACIDEVRGWAWASGEVEGFDLAVTAEEAWLAFEDFVTWRLPSFGPYEDAMAARSDVVYHGLLSPYMNLGLLETLPMVRVVERCYHQGQAPLQSVEGFIRQVLGWREYMAWRYRHAMPALAHANFWGAKRPVPRFMWTGSTPMRCLHSTLERTWRLGYTHHIERLMLLGNFFVLAGIEPRLATEWFAAAYIDAYDWVMQPNAMGMGLNADGGGISSKPYIASAAYIHRMSDYCKGCYYDPKQRHGERACPFNALYWSFLIEHEAVLRRNPRMGPAVLGLRHLDEAERARVSAAAAEFLASLEP